ncbi:MAG TPA: RNA-binding protein [Nodosilinea sp.]|nr:RNA-binding protein [Nodosilinea sp.]
MSIRLYVGNLSKDLERQEFENVFAEFNDDLVSVKLIADKKTGKCRGFGFVTVKTDEKADEIVEKLNGQVLAEMPLKIEKALPRTKPEGDTEARPSSEPTNGKRPSKGGGARKAAPAAAAATSSAAVQPDPRWAGELEKLKQMLATQTTSS